MGALQVRHYLFAGEARARGGLAALQGILPQAVSLPAGIADALGTELGTREQVVRLLGLLEEAIHCLVAVGARPVVAQERSCKTASATEGTPLIARYLRDVAMVSQERLIGLPPCVEQQASLRHLRALFLFAEDRLLGGSASAGTSADARDVLLPGVPQRYRAELPNDEKETLVAACQRAADLEEAIPALRDLLTGVLSDEATSY